MSEKTIRILWITLISVCFVVCLCSGIMVVRHFVEGQQRVEEFAQLAGIVEQVQEPDEAEEVEPVYYSEFQAVLPKYARLFSQNLDLVGWIKLEGTDLNYPVMQTPARPDYYLKRNFDLAYSDYGVPYIAEDCRVIGEQSDNLVIYGHNIKGGKMFGVLEQYVKEDFYREHPVIRFDTILEEAEYEIVAVFKTVAYSESGFRFYDFIDAEDKSAFNEYIATCKSLALYDTGVDAEYGDRLITVSTCEYSQINGRLVIVAKRIVEG